MVENKKFKKPLFQPRQPGGPGGGKGGPPTSATVKFFQANKVLIIVLGVLLVLAAYIIKKKPTAGDESMQSSENAEPSQETEAPIQPKNDEQVPSRAILPGQRESTQEELSNFKDEEPTPEFIAERKKDLLEQADIELSGGEKVLAQTKDPKAAAEIQERIDALKRFKQQLSNIKPNDPSTWKILEGENKEKGKSQI